MTLLDGSSGGELLIQPPIDNSIVRLVEQSVVISSESVAEVTNDDLIVDEYQSAITENRFSVEVTGDVVESIQCPEGSVSGSTVSRVSDGDATITVSLPTVKKGKRVAFLRIEPSSYQQFNRWVAGSLAEHCSDQIDSRISGATAAQVSGQIGQFSSRNTTSGIYVRNPGSWASDVDLTCVPANCPGIAITPRHLLVVTHYLGSGDIHFVTDDGSNTTVTRTRSAIAEVPGIFDMSIVTMNADLPDEITPVKLLPADIEDYLPNFPWRVAGLGSDQNRNCSIKESTGIESQETHFSSSLESPRSLFAKNITVGDSGSPMCLVINGRLALMMLWTFGGGAGGAGYAPHTVLSAINTITSAVGSHTVDTVDLSEFNNYGG